MIIFDLKLARTSCPALVVLTLVLAGGMGIFAQCHFTTSGRSRTVTYRFQPDVKSDSLVLRVTVEFKMASLPTATLVLPNHWAGETLNAVTNLRVVSTGARLVDGANDDTKIVIASAHRRVLIAYDLKKDWAGRLINPMQFHPVLI